MAAYTDDLAALDRALQRLDTAATRLDVAASRRTLLTARIAYKRAEWLAEHYTPLTATALNGAALDRPDDESPAITIHPTGLQVIEALLFGRTPPPAAMDSVALQARIARINVKRLAERAAETEITDAQLFDAARLEVARVVSLGITGFDTPLSGHALNESAASLEAVATALKGFASGTVASRQFAASAREAAHFLAPSPDAAEAPGDRRFDTFDRYAFITAYANPMAVRLAALRVQAGVASMSDTRAFRANGVTLFDRDAFDAHAFAPPGAVRGSAALEAIGERLFFDAQLSGRGDRTCATCHQPARAFADGQRAPRLIAATARTHAAPATPVRNTPTLYNAALQAALFSDARVAFLEDQIAAVIENPGEMGGSMPEVVRRVARDPAYRTVVRNAMGSDGTPLDSAEMGRAIRSALAAYVRSLARLDSRFDRAMRGDATAMSANQRRGMNVFMGKGRCGTCHFAPLFNGTVPPAFADAEVEVLGVQTSRGAHAPLDADLGVATVDRAALHAHAFRTPSVRNARETAPYMHNGAYPTLESVIDFYDAGGGAGRGVSVPNQTLPSDSLHLTAQEKRDLVAFIGALSETPTARAASSGSTVCGPPRRRSCRSSPDTPDCRAPLPPCGL